MISISSYLSKAPKSLGKLFQAAFSERSSDKSDKNRRDTDPVRDYRTDFHICPAYVIQNSLKTDNKTQISCNNFYPFTYGEKKNQKNKTLSLPLEPVGNNVRLGISPRGNA